MALAVAMSLAAPLPAAAKRRPKGPTQVVPPKKKPKLADEDPSEGGQRRGITELLLGAVAGGAAVALVGRGIWEVGVGRRTRRECESGDIDDAACNRAKPGNGGFIAAGLSFGLVVPFGVASGLLMYRGAKINRAYKRWKQHHAAVAVAAGAHGAGVAVSLRF